MGERDSIGNGSVGKGFMKNSSSVNAEELRGDKAVVQKVERWEIGERGSKRCSGSGVEDWEGGTLVLAGAFYLGLR